MSHQSKFPFIYQPIPDKSSLPIISESFQISRDLPDILWEQTDVEDFVEGEKFIVKPKVKAGWRIAFTKGTLPQPVKDFSGKTLTTGITAVTWSGGPRARAEGWGEEAACGWWCGVVWVGDVGW